MPSSGALKRSWRELPEAPEGTLSRILADRQFPSYQTLRRVRDLSGYYMDWWCDDDEGTPPAERWVRLAEVRPAEVRPVEVRLAEVRPVEVDLDPRVLRRL